MSSENIPKISEILSKNHSLLDDKEKTILAEISETKNQEIKESIISEIENRYMILKEISRLTDFMVNGDLNTLKLYFLGKPELVAIYKLYFKLAYGFDIPIDKELDEKFLNMFSSIDMKKGGKEGIDGLMNRFGIDNGRKAKFIDPLISKIGIENLSDNQFYGNIYYLFSMFDKTTIEWLLTEDGSLYLQDMFMDIYVSGKKNNPSRYVKAFSIVGSSNDVNEYKRSIFEKIQIDNLKAIKDGSKEYEKQLVRKQFYNKFLQILNMDLVQAKSKDGKGLNYIVDNIIDKKIPNDKLGGFDYISDISKRFDSTDMKFDDLLNLYDISGQQKKDVLKILFLGYGNPGSDFIKYLDKCDDSSVSNIVSGFNSIHTYYEEGGTYINNYFKIFDSLKPNKFGIKKDQNEIMKSLNQIIKDDNMMIYQQQYIKDIMKYYGYDEQITDKISLYITDIHSVKFMNNIEYISDKNEFDKNKKTFIDAFFNRDGNLSSSDRAIIEKLFIDTVDKIGKVSTQQEFYTKLGDLIFNNIPINLRAIDIDRKTFHEEFMNIMYKNTKSKINQVIDQEVLDVFAKEYDAITLLGNDLSKSDKVFIIRELVRSKMDSNVNIRNIHKSLFEFRLKTWLLTGNSDDQEINSININNSNSKIVSDIMTLYPDKNKINEYCLSNNLSNQIIIGILGQLNDSKDSQQVNSVMSYFSNPNKSYHISNIAQKLSNSNDTDRYLAFSSYVNASSSKKDLIFGYVESGRIQAKNAYEESVKKSKILSNENFVQIVSGQSDENLQSIEGLKIPTKIEYDFSIGEVKIENPFYDKSDSEGQKQIQKPNMAEANKELIKEFLRKQGVEVNELGGDVNGYSLKLGIDINKELRKEDFERLGQIMGKKYIEKIEGILNTGESGLYESELKEIRKNIVDRPMDGLWRLFERMKGEGWLKKSLGLYDDENQKIIDFTKEEDGNYDNIGKWYHDKRISLEYES